MQFGADVGQLRLGFHARYALVHLQALVFFRNVIGVDADVEAEIELGFGLVGRGLALHFADGALEHLRVKFEADGLDVSALLAAEKIACAAQFEIERGDFESGAEVGEFFQRGEAAAGDGREFDFFRDQQVCVGAAVRAADASAQLVELGKAEAVGAIDQRSCCRAGCRGRSR